MKRTVTYAGFLGLTVLVVVNILALGAAPKKQPGVIGQPGATTLPVKQ